MHNPRPEAGCGPRTCHIRPSEQVINYKKLLRNEEIKTAHLIWWKFAWKIIAEISLFVVDDWKMVIRFFDWWNENFSRGFRYKKSCIYDAFQASFSLPRHINGPVLVEIQPRLLLAWVSYLCLLYFCQRFGCNFRPATIFRWAHLFADAFLFLSTSLIVSCLSLSLFLLYSYLSSCFYSQPTSLLLFSLSWPPLCSLATFGWCTQSRC